MSKSSYWEKRILHEEEIAYKLGTLILKMERGYYNQALKRIKAYVDALIVEIEELGRTPSRSELWRLKKFVDLKNALEKELKHIAVKQDDLLTDTLVKTFQHVMETPLEEHPKASDSITSFYSPEQIKQVIKGDWRGSNYSQRIYGNTSALSAKLQDGITDVVLLGRNPTEIKTMIVKEFGTSFFQADRLVRTELSHVFNESSLERYRLMGVKKVQIFTREDERTCEECGSYHMVIYPIDEVPQLPVHPNCRCVYLPVVE